MDEESDAPLALNSVTQFPYAFIPVPWSAILAAYRPSGEPTVPPITAETAELR